MDNGAQKSVAGLEAFKSTALTRDLVSSKESFKLGSGIYPSLGSTVIRFPIDSYGNFLEYETGVIDSDTPFLFGLDKMKQHQWYVNEVTNEFCNYDVPALKVKLTYKKGHLYPEWPSSVIFQPT